MEAKSNSISADTAGYFGRYLIRRREVKAALDSAYDILIRDALNQRLLDKRPITGVIGINPGALLRRHRVVAYNFGNAYQKGAAADALSKERSVRKMWIAATIASSLFIGAYVYRAEHKIWPPFVMGGLTALVATVFAKEEAERAGNTRYAIIVNKTGK